MAVVAIAGVAAVIPTGDASAGIAFTSFRSGSYGVWVMNADGSSQRRLTTNASQDQEPAWSPSGTRIAFTSFRSGSYDVYTIGVNGTGLRRLTTHASQDHEPDW